jgi:hypothetical protein
VLLLSALALAPVVWGFARLRALMRRERESYAPPSTVSTGQGERVDPDAFLTDVGASIRPATPGDATIRGQTRTD